MENYYFIYTILLNIGKYLLGVLLMNKKEAIAYAQVTLDYMQSSKYHDEITPDTLGFEMRQCFKLYPKDTIQIVANSQAEAREKLQDIENGSGTNG